MAKKSKRAPAARRPHPESPVPAGSSFPAPAAPQTGGIGAGGAAPFWAAASILVLAGYILLRKADPAGQNAFAVAAPACLLAGYLLFIPAITRTFRS